MSQHTNQPMNRKDRRKQKALEQRERRRSDIKKLEMRYQHHARSAVVYVNGSDPGYIADIREVFGVFKTRAAHTAAVSRVQHIQRVLDHSRIYYDEHGTMFKPNGKAIQFTPKNPDANIYRRNLESAVDELDATPSFLTKMDPPMPETFERQVRGFVHPNQKNLAEWSLGTKLTVMQLPIDGVAWHLPATQKPGGSHNTPGLVLRAVCLGSDMFFAMADGVNHPTYATFRIPVAALLGFLAKAQSLGVLSKNEQERTTIYFRQDGSMLGKEPHPTNTQRAAGVGSDAAENLED